MSGIKGDLVVAAITFAIAIYALKMSNEYRFNNNSTMHMKRQNAKNIAIGFPYIDRLKWIGVVLILGFLAVVGVTIGDMLSISSFLFLEVILVTIFSYILHLYNVQVRRIETILETGVRYSTNIYRVSIPETGIRDLVEIESYYTDEESGKTYNFSQKVCMGICNIEKEAERLRREKRITVMVKAENPNEYVMLTECLVGNSVDVSYKVIRYVVGIIMLALLLWEGIKTL